MGLIAVLAARATLSGEGTDPVRRGELGFAGQTLVEYQARQAHARGAGTVAILVDKATPTLARAVDRLGQDGIHAALVRDLPALGRMVAPADDILLLAEGHVLPNADLARLTGEGRAAMLVLPSTPATEAFERIDAAHMWAGALACRGVALLGLLDMLGEWDLELTLLRRLVQQGAERLACDVAQVLDGRLTLLDDPGAADVATAALAAGDAWPGDRTGDIDDVPVGWPASRLAPFVLRHEVGAAAVRIGAIVLATLGFLAVLGGAVAIGLVAGFLALIADRVAERLDALLRLDVGGTLVDRLARMLVLAIILVAGVRGGGGAPSAIAMAVLSVGLLALGRRLVLTDAEVAGPPLFRFAPGVALLLLLLGAVLGALDAAAALVALIAFASHSWLLLAPSSRRVTKGGAV